MLTTNQSSRSSRLSLRPPGSLPLRLVALGASSLLTSPQHPEPSEMNMWLWSIPVGIKWPFAQRLISPLPPKPVIVRRHFRVAEGRNHYRR